MSNLESAKICIQNEKGGTVSTNSVYKDTLSSVKSERNNPETSKKISAGNCQNLRSYAQRIQSKIALFLLGNGWFRQVIKHFAFPRPLFPPSPFRSLSNTTLRTAAMLDRTGHILFSPILHNIAFKTDSDVYLYFNHF